MSQELQGLLDRIQKEGVEQAQKQKDEIISQAKSNAESIIQRTNMEAENILKTAKEEVKKIEERSKSTIQQAARDIAISLETELLKRLKKCVKSAVSESMTTSLMTEVIKKMVEAYSKSSSEDIKLDLILAQKDINTLTESLKTSLIKDLKTQPQIIKGSDFSSGLKIGFNGSDVFLDFSDSTITDLICDYVSPRLSAILKGDSK